MEKSSPLKSFLAPQKWLGPGRSLRQALFLSFIAIAIIPLVLVGLATIQVERQSVEQNVQNKLQVVARLQEATLNSWIETATRQLSEENNMRTGVMAVLGYQSPLQSDEQTISLFQHDIDRIQSNNDYFESISVLTLDGIVRVSNDEQEIDKDYSSEPFFENGLKDSYIHELVYDETSDTFALYISTPIISFSDDIVGVYLGKANLSALRDILNKNAELSRDSETYLVSKNYHLFNVTSETKEPVSEGIEQALDGREGSGLYQNYANKPVVGAYQWLETLQAGLLAEQSQDAAFANSRKLAALNVGVLILMGFVAFMVALFLTHRIVQPIDQLTQVATRIAAGDHQQTISVRRRDEIGILGQAFNEMTYQLRNLIDTLEERIQRRTQLLQTSAEVGRRISDILDLESLLLQVSNLVKERFSYYHVQVFLTDEEGYMVTRAGAGTIGAQMTAMGYRLKVGSESLVGRAGLGQLQLANDVSRNPHWHYNDLLPETKAELALPLRLGINAIGVLDVQSNRVDAFSDADLTMLQSIADQLTIAVRNARLFQESEASRQQAEKILADLQKVSQDLTRRSTQLHTAIEVSKAASTILDTQQLIQQVVNRIKDRFDYYYVGLFMIDAVREWAILRAGTGEAGKQQIANEHKLKVGGASMVGWCVTHGQARIALDVNQDDVHYSNIYLPETRSEMALPLISRGEILGALSIQSVAKDAFSTEDIDILQTMADQIAVALQNAQLFSDAQASRKRFHDLYNRAPAGYQTLSDRGVILEINDMGLKLLGREDQRDDIVRSHKLADFLEKESKQLFDAALPDITAGQEIQNLELVYCHPDGKKLPILLTASPTLNQKGEFLEISTSVQDISLLKAAEVARESLLTETNTLYTLGQQLLTAENREQIYQACVEALKTINPGQGIAVLMYRQIQGRAALELSASWQNPGSNWSAIANGDNLPVVEFGLDNAVLPRETFLSTNVTEDDHLAPPIRDLLDYLEIKSVIGAPIWSRGNIVGFILVSHHDHTAFEAEAVRLFEGVVQQMSINIEKLALLQEAQERANQLEAAAEVSKNTTSEVNLSVLLPQTVDLIKDVFDYYHVSIFLLDDYQRYAVLKAASGTIGQKQLEERFKLPIDQHSIIGNAILEGKVRMVLDVEQEQVYTKDPLLPDTGSEIVLPLIYHGEVIGVLDVQNTKGRSFNQGDVIVLQTIADQLSNAIYVARLFERERKATQEIQELHRQYMQTEWESYLRQETSRDNNYIIFTTENDLSGNEEDILTENQFSNIQGDVETRQTPNTYRLNLPTDQEGDNNSRSILAGPLMLRNQMIGTLGFIDDADRSWSEDDLEILNAVSAQATLAVENARLIEETQRRALQLQISAQISQDVTASLDQNRLLQDSVNLIQTRFGFARVHLYLVDSKPAIVYRSYNGTESDSDSPMDVVIGRQSLVGQVMSQRKQILAQGDEVKLLEAIKKEHPQTKSALAIPLLVRQELTGVLEVHSNQLNAFTNTQITVLDILGSQITISLQNARAYQEQQEIAEKLREVDRLKTQFLANMSHELRTPLNSIIGFSRVILKGIDGPLTELQKADLNSIYQSGQHLLGLINDILDLAKIEAGKLDLIFSEINLKQLIHSVYSTALGLVKDKPIRIITEMPDELPNIVGDEIRIRQVLINLISNATKFTEEGSITIGITHDDEYVAISVVDTGIGIPEDELGAIFDEFTQVDSSTTRKAGGTGLGLPITKKFIELHQGTITVKSKPKVGSTFTITLPIFQQEGSVTIEAVGDDDPKSETQEEEVAEDASHVTILAVDDDEQVINLYRRYLKEKNYQIVGVNKSLEVVSVAKEVQPYAILLDILMPEKDGWRVIKELKANPYTAHIPVIICSIVDDRYRANSLGVADYLTKPVLEKDLLNALEKLRHNHNYKRVLIIDDNADDILLSRRMLEAREYQVIEASNGLDGLDIIYKNPPDLVILDLTMPDLDGFGVLTSLRDNPKTSGLPVIVITARDLSILEQDQITHQANALLTKGRFLDADLLDHIDGLFQQEPA